MTEQSRGRQARAQLLEQSAALLARGNPQQRIGVPAELLHDLILNYKAKKVVYTTNVIQPRNEDCPWCMTWWCRACGWERRKANPDYHEHKCKRCGSRDGLLVPIAHTDPKLAKRHCQEAEQARVAAAEGRPIPQSICHL